MSTNDRFEINYWVLTVIYNYTHIFTKNHLRIYEIIVDFKYWTVQFLVFSISLKFSFCVDQEMLKKLLSLPLFCKILLCRWLQEQGGKNCDCRRKYIIYTTKCQQQVPVLGFNVLTVLVETVFVKSKPHITKNKISNSM